MQLGASFSHRHLKYLNLDIDDALNDFKNLGLSWIRLGAYWDEIEKEEGRFSFKDLEPLIKYCEKNNIKVVLTVGMKAPRYPEYYIPDWLISKTRLRRLSKITLQNKYLLERTLIFIEKVIKHFKKYSSLKIWQVENEPLDFAGPSYWRIDSEFLKQEVELVRKLDPRRKIMVNTWGNEMSRRKTYKTAAKLADTVGLDIYLRHPIPFLRWLTRYIGPFDSRETTKNIVKEIKKQGVDVWLAELQAEPWENDKLVTSKENPPSFLPEHFEENVDYALSLKPLIILFWGFEYWLWKKSKGDQRYWEEAEKVIQKFPRV